MQQELGLLSGLCSSALTGLGVAVLALSLWRHQQLHGEPLPLYLLPPQAAALFS